MSKELSEFYYQRALNAANQDNLTSAVQNAALSIGLLAAACKEEEKEPEELSKEEQKRYKLAGLCYDRLGNYTMATLCLSKIPDYFFTCREELEQKKVRIDTVRLLVSGQKYRQVIRLLKQTPGKSVVEYQYLGLCYGVLKKYKKASGCFMHSMSLDTGNEEVYRIIKEQKFCTTMPNRKKGWWAK